MYAQGHCVLTGSLIQVVTIFHNHNHMSKKPLLLWTSSTNCHTRIILIFFFAKNFSFLFIILKLELEQKRRLNRCYFSKTATSNQFRSSHLIHSPPEWKSIALNVFFINRIVNQFRHVYAALWCNISRKDNDKVVNMLIVYINSIIIISYISKAPVQML